LGKETPGSHQAFSCASHLNKEMLSGCQTFFHANCLDKEMFNNHNAFSYVGHLGKETPKATKFFSCHSLR